ncbi:MULTISPECIES: translocation/assembly module TamB domain-containing protein [unclassified Duganella]|uniref:translocation/assembly module TamB domain-containing protein n=1 Tax=unclassified Duganella TaxID=2636909 RepID=UPI00088B5778|nr:MULTISPECIES: translocation/assembly module TamB domain-containing protein [unclassified Duganella]SDH17409.1 translocation and assembly module TamB [Duganella sp. OV458]SDK31942.1 translocation and assembly module TamB [Duganella sp. OV510]
MADQQDTPQETVVAPRRRWPRRVAIGFGVLVALLVGAFWLLGRESTLQQLVQRLSAASGGQITVTGVSGSLYHRMHIDKLVYRSKDSVVTAEQIDINWSPLQYFSEGLTISELHARSLLVQSTGPSEPARMPESLASPIKLSISDGRLDKLTLASEAGSDVIESLRFQLNGDRKEWRLQNASARTAFGDIKADATIAGSKPFALNGKATLTYGATAARDGAAANDRGAMSASAAGADGHGAATSKPGAVTGGHAEVAPGGARLAVQVAGDLSLLSLKLQGAANGASGEAALSLAPFDKIILRAIDLTGRDLDPAGFDATWPEAKFSLKLTAAIAANQKLSGQFALLNQGKAAPLDQSGLPLQAFSGRLDGTLTSSVLDNVLLDLGPAGKFTGGGKVDRSGPEAGIDAAQFKLRTERLDLKNIHTSINKTAIAGDISATSTPKKQTLAAALVDKGMRLDLQATLADALLQLHQLRLQAKKGSITATGQASLKDKQEFSAKVSADHFDPSALGTGYPIADLNADINAKGALTPAWQVAADFNIKASKLIGQALTGKGKLNADARHISGVDAHLSLAQNTADISGNFGAPGEQLKWKIDARQLSAVSSDLLGAITASGIVTGAMDAPRSSFEADARGLAFASAKRPADSVIHASGDVAMVKGTPELKLTGSIQRLNPASFGAAQAGAINATFSGDARLAGDWRAALNLALQPSTFANAPLSGYAKLTASKGAISNADIDLHLASNSLQAKGSFGSAADKLEWRLDAPQLGALGPQFGGALRASGTASGTSARPAIALTLDGSNLRAPGQQQVATIRGSATLGNTIAMASGSTFGGGATFASGATTSVGNSAARGTTSGAAENGRQTRGPGSGATASARGTGRGNAAVEATADVPLVSDIEITRYVSPSISLDRVRLQTSGTRSAHIIQLSAANPDFDAALRVKGSWADDTWTGAIDTLQNKGRFALTLAAPAPLKLSAPQDTGVAGLLKPEQIALGSTVINLPAGSIRIDNLEKTGATWRSNGRAAGVPVNYLAQLSDAWRDNVRSNMTIGAEWGVNLQAATRTLAGMVHVYREQGDLTIIGADLPQALGLRTLDARADVNDGTLRVQLSVDGTRAGQAKLDGSAQLHDGRLADDSTFTLTGSANMGSLAWLAPLAGQPGLEIDGTFKMDVNGSGTIAAPQLSGDITGDKLVVNWLDQGIKLRNGQLQARLSGDQLQLQKLAFDGAQGRAQADGWIRYAANEATMQLKLTADKLEVLSRPDRILVISGSSSLVRDAKHFQLDGKVRADRARIELAGANTPTLSDDVVIVGKGAPQVKAPQGMPLNVDIEADLGNDFNLSGKGLDAQLAGALRIRVADRRPPRVNGSIRVVNGTYAAYGQKLAIDRGVINFTGAYDNPGLNILAVRRRPEGEALSETNVEAGVEVRGTALAPQAKLVSTPTVSDSDKLAWLVLGHGIENTQGNDMALLSTAAGALFGGGGGQGKLASALGVDELGVGQAAGTSTAGAATGLQNTVVTVGKRISSRAYLSFEQGASSATSLVKLKYKLNPRITLQFQTGTNNALDVLYTWAFD